MDVQEILGQARSNDVPASWDVWKLRGDRVSQDLGLYVVGAIVGLVLLGLAAHVMIPDNFRGSTVGIVASLLILAVLALVGFGSLALVVDDLLRLRRASQYLLVMTPDDFVKVEPGRVTHVPMDQIDSITLKGVKVKKDNTPEDQARSAQASAMDRMLGLVVRQPKVLPSLAFRDRRNDDEVVVGRDNSFGDLVAIEQALSFHVRAKSLSQRA